jgi:hypothetical protein
MYTLCLFAFLIVAGAPSFHVAVAAEPGSATGPRFAVTLGGSAVEDKQTGLTWEQEPDRFHGTWSEAAAHCRDKVVAGQTGWRIPAVKELSTLMDPSQRDPALPAGHPFSNVKSAIYWTGTPSATDDMVAWHVSFFTGEAVTDQKSQTRRVWCVHDAAAPPVR